MKKVLIVSPHFPPVNTPDMQRVRMSLPYFRDLGWEPVVICVDEQYVEGYIDEILTQTYPKDIKIYRVKAYAARLTRKFGLGSLSMRSFFQFRKVGNGLLRKGDFDMVYFSTTAFHVCRLGPYWKRKFKVPFIIDMQDPWRNDFYLDKPAYERPPKFLVSYNIDKYLEAVTIPAADGIISVSEGYKNTLMQRYPSLDPARFAIIPFGASYRDFEIMEQQKHTFAHLSLPTGRMNILYIGRGGHDLRFALEIIFGAFSKGLKKSTAIFSSIHFTFIGTSYAPGGKGSQTILPIAKEFGVEEYVTEIPARIPYFETLYLLKKADVLLVPGSEDTSYTASKIYPYILANKPLLAIFYFRSSVVNVLEDLKFGRLIKFDIKKSSADYTEECLQRFNEIVECRDINPNLDKNKFEKYTAGYKTKEQVSFFESVLKQVEMRPGGKENEETSNPVMRSIKILVIGGGAYVYGAEKVTLSIVGYLHRYHKLFCTVIGWNDGSFVASLKELGIPYAEVKLGWYYLTKMKWTIDSLVHIPGAYFDYLKIIRKQKPDVFYHTSYRTLLQLYPLISKKNVYHVHDELSHTIGKKILPIIDKKIIVYIANSGFIKKDLVKCGISEHKIKVIYNGVDFRGCSIPPYPFHTEGVVQIGIVGQVSFRKGHATLLNALAQLKVDRYDFRLHIFGSGSDDYINQLKHQIHLNMLDDHIIWHGYVHSKAEIYNKVDFCIVPSVLPESFGLTAVEPAIFGRPVVASRIGGLEEIIISGKTGFLFTPGDVAELKACIKNCIDHPGLVAELGKNAQDEYVKRFSENILHEKVDKLLSDIVYADK
ncbi:MAG: glycosyltransferase [Ferruginibacter sp.]